MGPRLITSGTVSQKKLMDKAEGDVVEDGEAMD